MVDDSPLYHSSLGISPGVMANFLGALSVQPIPQRVKACTTQLNFGSFH